MTKVQLVTGRVVRGKGYGRVLGFPTVNIDRRHYVRSRQRLALGIYAGEVILPTGQKYRAGIVIGPLDQRNLPKLEAHLLGYQGNLYGKRLTFRIMTYLRPFKSYKSEALLRRDIAADIKRIKQLKFTHV